MKKAKRQDYAYLKKIIKRQSDEIEGFKEVIHSLKDECNNNEIFIEGISNLQTGFVNAIEELRKKGEEYDALLTEMTEMKKAINNIVFKKKWKLIRWLLK